MKVFVVGSGGREHALAWKLSQESEVFACPGNPGIAQVAECVDGDPVAVAQAIRPDLIVIGPENPLIEGLADNLRALGFAVFGPGARGAQLEASKAFSKDLMAKAGVPTAAFGTFSDAAQAIEFARARYDAGYQVAVKASGAALGKGVVVCETFEEASEAIEMMMVDREFGDAGATVVIEDRLVGREFSLLTLCSGTSFLSLPIAQDYKRALDGDRGPNTGGMGTYSPCGWVSDELVRQSEAEIVAPLLSQLANDGIDYRGVLFSGVMVQDGVPYCLEYNVRFGDPETQTVMRRLGSGFLSALMAVAEGRAVPQVEVLDNAAVTVVMASGGYPGQYEKGRPISIPDGLSESVVVFHAGTLMRDGKLVTSGGRVLGVSEVGKTVDEARAKAYSAVSQIQFEGAFARRDVGT